MPVPVLVQVEHTQVAPRVDGRYHERVVGKRHVSERRCRCRVSAWLAIVDRGHEPRGRCHGTPGPDGAFTGRQRRHRSHGCGTTRGECIDGQTQTARSLCRSHSESGQQTQQLTPGVVVLKSRPRDTRFIDSCEWQSTRPQAGFSQPCNCQRPWNQLRSCTSSRVQRCGGWPEATQLPSA